MMSRSLERLPGLASGAAAGRLGALPVCLPCKFRAIYSGLEFPPTTNPTLLNCVRFKLKEYISAPCMVRGVNFINPTTALTKSCNKVVLTHNTTHGTHLSREGSRIVGKLLAKSLSSPP